ncbi:MAG: agmatinase [Deferrisomatales bacterium]
MNLKTLPTGFLECTGGPQAPLVVLGLPFDGTCSFRPGCRFGPRALRDASWGLETYSPDLDRELPAGEIFDAGDLDLPLGNTARALEEIGQAARDVRARGARLLGLGGEHLVTYPLLQACLEDHPELTLLHFDAHADLREDYLGEPWSHATVIRRCLDGLGWERVRQFGIRSGTRFEFAWMRKHRTRFPADADGVRRALEGTAGPLYVSVDLDVFDPSCVPGTGTPEPGGIPYGAFAECVQEVAASGRPVVGADVVELSPPHDPSGISAVLAAKVARELLILLGAHR